MRSLLSTAALLLLCIYTYAQEQSTEFIQRTYQTVKVTNGDDIMIDGDITDAQWSQIDWDGDFTVQQPNNGEKPQRQTQFKLIYDDAYLYLAFHCDDDDPTKIESRLARRDNFPGDWVEFNVDSYGDNATAFSFTISASGVKGDEFITGNGNSWDSSWNPIWYAASEIVADGWTAEMKIPLSQIRFSTESLESWGFNFTRRDFRADERSSYQFVPQTVSGWVSNFAHLIGVADITPKRQVEIQPYITSGLKFNGEPNGKGETREMRHAVGLDAKIGITSDLTLDFTLNPDFGQVEADPSALNIDGFQIFFREQRPFFVENANLFDFRLSGTEAGGSHGNDNLFYSRRIGANPRGNVLNGNVIDYPDFTNIIGAAKFSGKTKDGWSVGVIEAVTSREYAEVEIDGQSEQALVEPLSNFIVGRVSKDLNGGATIIGATLTNVLRDISDTPLEDQFHDQATTFGVNLFHSWQNREWQIKANVVGSNVEGTTTKITDTQESFEHYHQRPDADYLSVDTTLTSLNGNGGRISLANYGGQDNISFETGFTWRSPDLDLNDIGFLNTADQMDHFTWIGWRSPRPFSVFRSYTVNYNHYSGFNSQGDHLYQAFNMNTHASFTNYWNAGMGFNLEVKDISQKALFGGPNLRRHRGVYRWLYFGTDNRKKARVNVNLGGWTPLASDKGALKTFNANIFFSYQPYDAFRMSIGPSFRMQDRQIQNVSSVEYNGETRYITGRIMQESFGLSVRGSFSFSPNLTVEYWGQPFISKGTYDDFKMITDPMAEVWTDRFERLEDRVQQDESGTFLVDHDQDGSTDYSFGDPDFNFMQFRSNMVLRWEYTPGSELFVVWSQSTTNGGDPENGLFTSLQDDLFGSSFDNIFLVKYTYRFYRK